MTTPVSFELAKLLIQKEYNLHPDFKDSYPTIAEVVMWLYEKHGIWITVWSVYNNSYKFSYGILHRKNIVVFHETNFDEKDSPTEAYEGAIEHVLRNLI